MLRPSQGTPPRLGALALAVTLLAATGCSLKAREDTGPTSSRSKIVTAAEIEASGASSAWDAMRRLFTGVVRFDEDPNGQPTRMWNRGASSISLRTDPLVYVDGVRMGDFRLLEEMSAHTISTIEFLPPMEAATRYGTNAGQGVFRISTKENDRG